MAQWSKLFALSLVTDGSVEILRTKVGNITEAWNIVEEV
jgi:transcriptional regulator of nitric oxide reductase